MEEKLLLGSGDFSGKKPKKTMKKNLQLASVQERWVCLYWVSLLKILVRGEILT